MRINARDTDAKGRFERSERTAGRLRYRGGGNGRGVGSNKLTELNSTLPVCKLVLVAVVERGERPVLNDIIDTWNQEDENTRGRRDKDERRI